MTIASEITRIQGNISDAYLSCSNKGATIPAQANSDNLANCISSIPTGSTINNEDITVTTNGTYTASSGYTGLGTVEVTVPTVNNTTLSVTPTTSSQSFTPSSPYTGYGTITVNAVTSSIDANIQAGNIKDGVSILGVTGTYTGGGGSGYTEFPSYQVSGGIATLRSCALTGNEFNNITEIGTYGLYNTYYYQSSANNTITGSVSFPNLTTVGLSGMRGTFQNQQGITSISFPELITVGESGFSSTFWGTTGITGSVSFPKLTTIGKQGFGNTFRTSSITGIEFPLLQSIGRQGMYSGCFYGCPNLVTVRFTSLNSIDDQGLYACFYSCTSLTDVYFNALTTTSFGSYKNQFQNMLGGTGTGVTHTLHFPSNLESKIQSLTGYPLFGGTSGYVTLSFDLTATT